MAGPPPDRELGGDHHRGPGFVSDLFGFISDFFGFVSDLFGFVSDLFGFVSDLLDLFGPREKPYFGAVALEMFFFLQIWVPLRCPSVHKSGFI